MSLKWGGEEKKESTFTQPLRMGTWPEVMLEKVKPFPLCIEPNYD